MTSKPWKPRPERWTHAVSNTRREWHEARRALERLWNAFSPLDEIQYEYSEWGGDSQRDVHAPGVSLGEFGELLFPGVEVLVAHALDCPLTLSGLARNLELLRNTTRRRLARLIELGLVERVGDHYYCA